MPVSDPEDHQHGSQFRDGRNHAQSTKDDTSSHPDHARRASVDKTVLRREQDALPRRLENHDEPYDRDEAENPPQLLPLAHSAHIVDIVARAVFLLLDGFSAEIDVGSGGDFVLRIRFLNDGIGLG